MKIAIVARTASTAKLTRSASIRAWAFTSTTASAVGGRHTRLEESAIQVRIGNERDTGGKLNGSRGRHLRRHGRVGLDAGNHTGRQGCDQNRAGQRGPERGTEIG